MSQEYKDPAGGTPSDIGSQLRTDHYQKKALIEAAKETYFGQMADTTSMPKNMGKTIKRYHYLPLLDDANINDQGIDANGVTGFVESTIVVHLPNNGELVGPATDPVVGNGADAGRSLAVGEGNNATNAYIAAELRATDLIKEGGFWDTDYATSVAAIIAAGGGVTSKAVAEARAVPESGNLYGSSKDVGTISGKFPTLTENGGRVKPCWFQAY